MISIVLQYHIFDGVSLAIAVDKAQAICAACAAKRGVDSDFCLIYIFSVQVECDICLRLHEISAVPFKDVQYYNAGRGRFAS